MGTLYGFFCCIEIIKKLFYINFTNPVLMKMLILLFRGRRSCYTRVYHRLFWYDDFVCRIENRVTTVYYMLIPIIMFFLTKDFDMKAPTFKKPVWFQTGELANLKIELNCITSYFFKINFTFQIKIYFCRTYWSQKNKKKLISLIWSDKRDIIIYYSSVSVEYNDD